jgi:hypothetical protein
MITFLTLFLGLTTGLHPVEVVAGDEVARVELRLDGETVAASTGPPWSFEVDFGERLVPRRLEAIGFDARGERIGQVAQRVNLELSVSMAQLVLERDAAGRAVAVRPISTSIEFDGPSVVEVTFDSRPLGVADPARVPLPAHDPDVIHVVSVEMTFPDDTRARADLAFGGVYGEEVSTENTAVALEVDGPRALRRPLDARDLLRVDGRTVQPLAVESGAVDVVVVIDHGAREVLEELDAGLDRETARKQPREYHLRRNYDSTTSGAGLRDGDRLFFVGPWPQRATPSGVPHFIFRVGELADRGGRGLTWGVTHVDWEPRPEPQWLADAVAVAGSHAAALRRPRAVLLVLGSELGEDGRHTAEQARQLLAAVRVPLFVWYLGEPPPEPVDGESRAARTYALARYAAGRQERLASAGRLWGEVTEIETVAELVAAARTLRRSLEGQRVIWIDGLWLPREVALAPGSRGVRFLAGD